MSSKPKCEDMGFVHAWQTIENNFVYATYPPSYPLPERVCVNCGKREKLVTVQTEKKEWQAVASPQQPKPLEGK